jgi:hydrogenase maturation factor
MCLTLTGVILKIDEKEALVKVGNRKVKVNINPSVSLKKGDKVVIFRNTILDKLTK